MKLILTLLLFSLTANAELISHKMIVPYTNSDVGLGNVLNLDQTNPSNIFQNSSYRFSTDAEKATWNSKESAISFGTTAQYWRGDKSFQNLDTSVVPENGNQYWHLSLFNSAFSTKTTDNLTQGSTNLYWAQSLFDSAFASKSTDNLTQGSINKYYSDAMARLALSATAPMTYNSSTGVFSTPVFGGDSGTGGSPGLVPSPSPSMGEQGYVLGADGSFDPNDTSKSMASPFTYTTQSLAVSGNQKMLNAMMIQNGDSTYAIAGGGTTKTVSIYNVTDQSKPKLRGSILLSGTYGVCGDNTSYPYVFVPASGARTLTVLNISNPLNPVVTATYSWSTNTTSVYNCAYSNGLVFMAGQNHGLGILDVGNGVSGGTITAPVLAFDEGALSGAGQICNVLNSCKSFGVAVDPINKIVYSTNYSTASPWTYRQLKAYSYASSITSPTLLQNLTLPANTKANQVVLNLGTKTAYVTDTNQNLIDVVDLTNVSTGGMTNLSTFAPTGGRGFNSQAAAITTSGSNFVYVPSGGNSVTGAIDFYDLTSRTSPKYVNTVVAPGTTSVFGAGAIDPRGGYLYIGDYGNGTSGSALDVFTIPYETPTFGKVSAAAVVLPAGDVQSQINSLAGCTTNTVSSNFTIPTLTKCNYLNVDTSGGSISITMPDAISSSGFCVDVKNIGSPVSNATLSATGVQTIDRNANFVQTTQNQSTKFCAVNNNWWIY